MLDIRRQNQAVTITWTDGSVTQMPFIWLRDNDPTDLHPDTHERVFDLTSVPIDITPLFVTSDDEGLVLQWPDKPVPSRYATGWLAEHRPGIRRTDAADLDAVAWSAGDLGGIPRVDATACLTDDHALAEALRTLKRAGLVIVDGLDGDPAAGERVGERIGFTRQTNFGVIFEVRSVPQPINLAYTAIALPLHTDLPNQALVPGVQFLHCIRNDAVGGESVFADGFRIAQDLREEAPEDFHLLADTPIPWRFHDEDCDIRHRRPIIGRSRDGTVTSFVFNAHIADVPDLPADELPAFYAAYQRLMRRVRAPRYAVRHRLERGQMVAFDNTRVLHARAAFDPTTGGRHLRGFYIDHNEIDSRLRVLARDAVPTPHAAVSPAGGA